jgi:predicted NBD/HSP70 family sugar kinase
VVTITRSPSTGTPSLLRSINGRAVLELIATDGPLSRAQIARLTGMSKPTASITLSRLLASGIVREAGLSTGRKGPAAVLYDLNPRAGGVVAVDLTRGRIRVAVADLSGHVRARAEEATRVRSAPGLIDHVGALARTTAKRAGLAWRTITHCVVGTPGVVSDETQSLLLAESLPGWNRPGVVDALQRNLGTTVIVDNDVDLAAIGELRVGGAQGVDDFVFVSVGAGIGMGLILGGRLYRGAHGAAGEIGYLPLGEPRPMRRSGRGHGRLEAAAGTDAMIRNARERGLNGRITVRHIFAAARGGDEVAQEVVADEARRVADAVAAIVPVVDPALVVLGGEIGLEADLLLASIEQRLIEVSPLQPPVVISSLGTDAVLQGALVTAVDAAQDFVFRQATQAPTGPQVVRA